ncbi:hypothetical protein [Streptomyces sp. NPDC018610]|uniref:Rv1733c family protein n=1 Tax=Streptomyces sp. NPDC018610 TaxID=3365049 RepID=UPI0037AB7CC7
MAVRGPQVWLWRWRRNPLRRRADAVEAWVVLGVWLLTVAAGALAGWAGARGVERGLARERLEWRPTVALVTRTAPVPVSGDDPGRPGAAADDEGAGHGGAGDPASVWAQVRWTAPDGAGRTGRIRVASGSAAGTAVTVWTDRGGRLVTRPPTAAQAHTRSLVIGGLAGVGAAAVPFVCGRLLRARLERRRLDRWDVEWARFDPLWGRETR